MNVNEFVICCDMDDTIEYLVSAWLKWLNNKYNTYVEYIDVKDWDMSISFPDLTEDQLVEPLFKDEIWKTVEPMKDAIFYIKKLIDEGFPFYIVTSSHPNTIKPKFEHVLYRGFPFIDRHNVIISYNKQMIRCNLLIDDGTHNIVGPYIGFLKDTSHNQTFNESDYPNIYRVHCWKEIYELIHKLIDQ